MRLREWGPALRSMVPPLWRGADGGGARRPELDRMMAACRRRQVDAVVVYRYDRFARSLRQLVNALCEFDSLGIQFVSLHAVHFQKDLILEK